METYQLYATEANIRIDTYLASQLSEINRTNIARLIESNNIFVNNKNIKKSYKVKLNDFIEIIIPAPTITDLIPQELDLNIIYEDEEIIVLNKQQGVVVHPGNGNFDKTLVNGLLYHCKDLKAIGDELRPGVVHRLDKDTSGVILFAKSGKSLTFIANQFKEHTNTKIYYAIVCGNPPLTKKIETFYKRDPNNRLKYTSKTTDGKEAITYFEKIKQFKHFALLKITLKTGRTHQIRVHLNDLGFTIVGDVFYGFNLKSYKYLNIELYKQFEQLSGQLLHAEFLEIIHPITNEKISFQAPFYDYFNKTLELIEKYDYN